MRKLRGRERDVAAVSEQYRDPFKRDLNQYEIRTNASPAFAALPSFQRSRFGGVETL